MLTINIQQINSTLNPREEEEDLIRIMEIETTRKDNIITKEKKKVEINIVENRLIIIKKVEIGILIGHIRLNSNIMLIILNILRKKSLKSRINEVELEAEAEVIEVAEVVMKQCIKL